MTEFDGDTECILVSVVDIDASLVAEFVNERVGILDGVRTLDAETVIRVTL